MKVKTGAHPQREKVRDHRKQVRNWKGHCVRCKGEQVRGQIEPNMRRQGNMGVMEEKPQRTRVAW